MNKQVRKNLEILVTQLNNALAVINSASDSVMDIYDSQNDILENIPENLQMSERASRQEVAVDALCNASTVLSDLVDELEGAIGNIQAAIDA